MSLSFFLHNWKCFESTQLQIPLESFAIVDSNGSGKTSIISALYSLFTKKPWPETKFTDSIKIGATYYGVISSYPNWTLVGQISNGRVTNKFCKPNLSPILEKSCNWPKIFTYLPTDNYWFSMPKSKILATLDNLLSQVHPNYQNQIKTLEKFIKSKNKYIKYCKQQDIVGDLLMVKQLTTSIQLISEEVWLIRSEFLEYLANQLPKYRTWIDSDLKEFTIDHQVTNSLGIKENYNKASTSDNEMNSFKLWQKELLVGRCLFGANRDEFTILSDRKNINTTLSRGEMRLLVLFIKNTARNFALQKDSSTPIWWFLDDIFNELDNKREKILFEKVLNKVDFYILTGTKSDISKISKILNYTVSELTIS